MKERELWFITRPERDPVFHVDALIGIQTATNNFEEVWSKNRNLHKFFEKVLIDMELKRNNVSLDGSGGRTWVAMLRTFGYIYSTDSGKLALTKVGLALLKGNKVKENISKQLLTLQIPNAYFLGTGFRPKFKEGFQIRPVRFLIRLINQERMEYYLTKEEITFFALTAQRDTELESITNKIISYRMSTFEEKKEMKNFIANKFDHRERSDKSARDFAQAHGDVAHTFMMLCEFTELVKYIRGEALRVPNELQLKTQSTLNELEIRYPFSKRYLISLERFSEHAGLDVDSYKSSSYGNISPKTNASKGISKAKRILAKYPIINSLDKKDIELILNDEFSIYDAKKYATEIMEYQYNLLNEDFVEAYLLERDNRAFEDKTGEVLRAIGFDIEMRPKPALENVSTEIEILLHLNSSSICIIDAKNYREKFSLSANLASHMGSEYIPNYENYKGKSVTQFGYITASDFGGVKNLDRITGKAKKFIGERDVRGAIFSAKALLGFLDYCLDNALEISERKRIFISLFVNKGYNDISEML